MILNRIFVISQYLAHAGERHQSTAEAQAHRAGTESDALAWLILLLGPLALAFIAGNLLRLKLLNILLVISLFLIGYGIWSYQDPGAHTAVAITGGFGIVFVTAILRLASE